MKKTLLIIISLTLTIACLTGCGAVGTEEVPYPEHSSAESVPVPVTDYSPSADGKPQAPPERTVPQYSGSATAVLNGNIPFFTENDLSPAEFISFSELDSLGRCGPADSCIGTGMLPDAERGNIGMIKPTGWQTVRYIFIDGQYLYNRCHLIAYELCGVNSDERNLITGTRYLNFFGMLAYENSVCEYVEDTGNHVRYRVTPWFSGDDLLCSGVQLEGLSVEDNGEGICFNVFCYNVQPGVVIDYLTGDSCAEELPDSTTDPLITDDNPYYVPSPGVTYVLNKDSMVFHYTDCISAQFISDTNRIEFYGTREEAVALGYRACQNCNP